MSDAFALIDDALDKTQRLLELAQQAQWQDFEELDAERQLILNEMELSQLSVSEQESEQVRSKMAELIAQNEQLVALCQTERDQIITELDKMKKKSKAAQAYSD